MGGDEKLPIVMPEIGAGRWPVHVSAWLVSVDEVVREGDRIIEVSLPGLTFDVNSPADGSLAAIEKSIGEGVLPGEVLGHIRPSPAD